MLEQLTCIGKDSELRPSPKLQMFHKFNSKWVMALAYNKKKVPYI
jgi:hypothetical protein